MRHYCTCWTNSLQSLDSYFNTSMEQQKDISLKLSSFIKQEKNLMNHSLNPKYWRTELFHSKMKMEANISSLERCLIIANSRLPLPMLASPLPTMPRSQRRISRVSCPSSYSDNKIKTSLPFRSIRIGFHNSLTILSCFKSPKT